MSSFYALCFRKKSIEFHRARVEVNKSLHQKLQIKTAKKGFS